MTWLLLNVFINPAAERTTNYEGKATNDEIYLTLASRDCTLRNILKPDIPVFNYKDDGRI